MKTREMIVTGVAMMFAAASPLMAADYTWSVNAVDPDNVLTNEVHFTPALADIPHTDAIKLTAASDMTVRMPAGSDWSAPFGLKFYVNGGHALTLDFDGATLTQPDTTAEAPYTQNGRFNLGLSGNVLQYAWPSRNINGAFRIEDALLTITNNIGGVDIVDFWRGTWDFLAPNSVTNAGGYLYIAASWPTTGKFKMNFHQGSEFRAPIFFIYGNARTNEINILGGSHYMASLQMRVRDSGGVDPYARTRVNVVGADTRLTIGGFSANSGEHLHGYRVYVGDGGTLDVISSIDQRPNAGHDFVFDGGNLIGKANKLYWRNARAFATNATFNTKNMYLQTGTLKLHNTTWNESDSAMIGYLFGQPSSEARVEVDGAESQLSFPKTYLGYDVGSTGVLSVAAGKVTFSDNFYLGTVAGSSGRLEFSGGELAADGYYAVVGLRGSGELLVSGGLFRANEMPFGWDDAANGTENSFRQTGGTIQLAGRVSLVSKAASVNVRSSAVLEGGVLETTQLIGGPGCSASDGAKTGVAILVGNGGTLRATKASTDFIAYLNSATCGAKGLTVESDYDVTIPQSFADMDGETGELILTGSGVKTLSGTATTVSKIVVAGGTVVFTNGARATSGVIVTNGARVVFAESPATIGLTGFVCGDASSVGVVTVAAGSPLDFGAIPVTLNKVQLCLDGEFATGSSYEMLRTTAAVSAASKAAWADALGAIGFSDSGSYSFSDSESGGATSFGMAVANAARMFSVASGTETISENVVVGNMETIVADVASGATLTFEGALSQGELSKTGEGRLFLESADNSFMRGVASSGGLLSAASVGAIGISQDSVFGLKLTGGTFEYRGDGVPATMPGALWLATPDKDDVVGLKIESPLTVRDVVVDRGAIIKRGVAPLTFAPPSGKFLRLAPSDGANVFGDPISPYGIGDLSDDTGALPSSGYLGFNVVEGEVRLVGDSNTTFRLVNAMIGVGATNGRVQPSLAIDGAKVDFSSSNMHVQMAGFAPAGSFNVAPTLLITNGADVSMHTFICGRNPAIITYPTVTVDRATWTLTSFRPGYNGNAKSTYFLRNGAVINAEGFVSYGPSYFFVTNSVVRKNSAGACTTAEFHLTGGKWLFGEGSTLALSTVKTTKSSPCTGFTLAFDGGTWETGGSADLFHLYRAEIFTFQTLGMGGLTLPIAEGKTLAVARAISGDGGIVKTGPGTLAFETQGTWDEALTEKTDLADPVSLAFGGLLDVREGSVTVASGACRAGGAYKAAEGTSVDFGGNSLANASFAGAGEFANATVSGVTISASIEDGAVAEAPTFDGVTISGAVAVDFARSADATETLEGLVVAHFAGGAPADLSLWRGRNAGSGFKASFAVSGDDVVARIVRTGVVVIFK